MEIEQEDPMVISGGATQQKYNLRIWLGQFFIGILVLVAASIGKHGPRKYTRADVSYVEQNIAFSCFSAAYVNVHSVSLMDEESLITCSCDELKAEKTTLRAGFPTGLLEPYGLLCQSMLKSLPMASRISNFPDSWIMTILPILLKLFLFPVIRFEKLQSLLTRLVLYISIMLIRGYILYSFLEYVENTHLVEVFDAGGTCWFQGMAKCSVRTFDFSDHIVFFYSHIIPLVVFEGMIAIDQMIIGNGKRLVVDVGRITCLVYCTYVVFISWMITFRTARIYHTNIETLVGFMISLIIQLPLGYILCVNDEMSSVTRRVFGAEEGSPKKNNCD